MLISPHGATIVAMIGTAAAATLKSRGADKCKILGYGQPNLRFPVLSPTKCAQNCPTDEWIPPPSGWEYGKWYWAWSSQHLYTALYYNQEINFYPLFPSTNETAGDNILLYSFMAGNTTTTLSTTYAIDTPQPQLGPYVFNDRAAGTSRNITTPYEFLAWGYDTNGDGYIVQYDGITFGQKTLPPDVSLLSRVVDGPSEDTRKAIITAMEAFGDKNITALAQALAKTPTDGRRDNMGTITCDASCVNNAVPLAIPTSS